LNHERIADDIQNALPGKDARGERIDVSIFPEHSDGEPVFDSKEGRNARAVVGDYEWDIRANGSALVGECGNGNGSCCAESLVYTLELADLRAEGPGARSGSDEHNDGLIAEFRSRFGSALSVDPSKFWSRDDNI
jgi:hypothetical protein